MSTLVTCLTSPLGCQPVDLYRRCTLSGHRAIFRCDPSYCPRYYLARSIRSTILQTPRRSRIHPPVVPNARLILSDRSRLLTNSTIRSRWKWLRESVYVPIFEYEAGGVSEALLEKIVVVRLDLPPQEPSCYIHAISLHTAFEFGSKPFTVQHGREPGPFTHVSGGLVD